MELGQDLPRTSLQGDNGSWEYYWQATKTRAEEGITGSQDLIDVMMQTKNEKRGLEFSTKELWLEVFLSGAVGKHILQLKHCIPREQRTTPLKPTQAPQA